jgi:hypothetical protein
MIKLTAVAALVATTTTSRATVKLQPKETRAGAAFPGSRLIAPAHGALLNSWANRTAEQTWKLCYTTFTMSKTSPAEFHKSCDQYKPTFTASFLACWL